MVFSTVILKKSDEKQGKLEEALVYMCLRLHVLAKYKVKACANYKKNFKKQCSKTPETELYEYMPETKHSHRQGDVS